MKTKAIRIIKKSKRHPVLGEIYRFISVAVGAVLVALGLELFLIPNGFLDGGVTGISILLSKFFPQVPMGVFLGVLNVPFVILSYVKVGRKTALRTAFGVAVLASLTVVLHHSAPLTDNFVLALGYGGLLLGLGVGLALRQGGALDGTEALASIISNQSRFSVDQLILGINIIIFLVAALVLEPQSAMASALLFYVVVSPIIKKVVDGNSDMKLAEIITDQPKTLSALIYTQIKRRITFTYRKKAVKGRVADEDIAVMNLLVSRLEESVLLEIVLAADPTAVVIFKEVSQVRGGIYEQESH